MKEFLMGLTIILCYFSVISFIVLCVTALSGGEKGVLQWVVITNTLCFAGMITFVWSLFYD